MENLRKALYAVADSIVEIVGRGVDLQKSDSPKNIQDTNPSMRATMQALAKAEEKPVKKEEKAPVIEEKVKEEVKEVESINFETLRAECKALAISHIKEKGRAGVVKLLEEFKATSIPTVKDEDLSSLKSKLEAL